MVKIRLEELTNGDADIEQAEDDGDADVESDGGDEHQISRVPVKDEFLQLRGSKFLVTQVIHHLDASPAATVLVVRLGHGSEATADAAY